MNTIAIIPTAEYLGISGQQERHVYECLLRGKQYSLTDIQLYLLSKGYSARETSISARIRDLNRRLRPNGFEAKWKYKKPGSTDTVYWLSYL